jgi:transcriptional regulator with XRE-family HTH domain
VVEQEEPRERLGRHVRQRRLQLNLSVRAAAQAAGLDRATWQGLEDGTRTTRDHKLAGIERVLGWVEGSVHTILAGGLPGLIEHQPEQAGAELPLSHDEVDEAQLRIIKASHAELVDLFRIVESAPGMTRSGADQWLVDALDLRERARQRREATKRDVS